MKCPECSKTMKWQEGLLRDGATEPDVGRHYCPDCNIATGVQESKAIRRGRRLAHSIKPKHGMVKEVTHHKCAVQIGMLREMQHCSTCERPWYGADPPDDKCSCKKCKCLYCREYKLG